MAVLEWDKTGERFYESGADHAVIYTEAAVKTTNVSDENYPYGKGTVWNGVTSVIDRPSGAEPTALYADNIKYAELRSAEEYGMTIEAYQSPEEFDECDGTVSPIKGVYLRQQKRKQFGFFYRTNLSNDTPTESDDGYKYHLRWGLIASPSEQTHDTINDSPDATTLSWECSSTPVNVPGYKPTASMDIDTTKVDAEKLKALEDILFGTSTTDAWLPMPDDVIKILKSGAEGYKPVAYSSDRIVGITNNI